MKLSALISSLCLFVTVYGATQSFVLEPKKNNKKESLSKLKERVCDSSAHCLQASSSLLKSLGDVQEQTICYVQKYAEGSKISADQQQLTLLASQLDEIAHDMDLLRKKIAQTKPLLINVTK